MTVGATMNETIGAAKAEEIGAAKSVNVGLNSSENVGKDKSVDAGKDINYTAGKDVSVQSGKKMSLEAGDDFGIKGDKKGVIEIADQLTIKVGSASITLKKNGDITISGTEVTAGSGHVGPNQMITWIRFSDTNMFHQYFFEAPIDETRTRIFFVNMRTFLLDPQHDGRIGRVNLVVAQQDINILAELDPVQTPDTTTKEVLVPSDRAVVVYRDWLKKFDQKGWRIDTDTMKAKKGKVDYAIPCPDRRTSGNWVLDPVPLQKA